MIEVIIKLHLVSEDADACWVGSCTESHFKSVREAEPTDADARATLRELFGHQFIRLDKHRPAAEQIRERIGYDCDIRQVFCWPLPISLAKEMQ